MRKILSLSLILLLATLQLQAQTPQEMNEKFMEFNDELSQVFGKDFAKSKAILDEIVQYWNSLPSGLKSDSSSINCQLNGAYLKLYNLNKNYDQAADYFIILCSKNCNGIREFIGSDEYADMLELPQSKEALSKVADKPDERLMQLSKKLQESVDGKKYQNSVENTLQLMAYCDSITLDREELFGQLYMVLSISYAALNKPDEALKYLDLGLSNYPKGSGFKKKEVVLAYPEFDNIRTSEGFRRFTDSIMPSPTYQPGAWGFEQDVPIKVAAAKASNEQRGDGIGKSIDGDISTIYHSSWTKTAFPITLTYDFETPEAVDYMVYYPRTEGTNGNFKEVDIYVVEGGKEKLVGSYNLKGQGSPSPFTLNAKQVEQVKLVVKSGMGDNKIGFASCAEMSFYRKNAKNTIPDLFSSNTCSSLKQGVTADQINVLTSPALKSLAEQLQQGTYDLKNRVKTYKPYPNPSDMAEKNRTGTYSLLDNATGIVAIPGEEIMVFVGDTKGEKIALRSINFDNDYSPVDYMLHEGANIIQCRSGGLLYIMYHTNDPKAKPVEIHIASGFVNGIYNSAVNTNSDWKQILEQAKHKYIDVQGKYAHLIFPVVDFKAYTPDISSLINVYDSIVNLESQFMGLEKYKRVNGNRMLFYVSKEDYYMFATANRTGYSHMTMPSICRTNKLRTKEIWGPAHEVGHVNQTEGLKWVGLTEVSNNIYSMYVQKKFGNKSRLWEETLNSDFDGIWANRYEKGFTELIANKVLHSNHGDVFCKLIPFWQLQLYLVDVKGYTDFYADVHERIRNLKEVPDDAQQQLNFMRICCDVAETDLSEFFERWGMLAATSGDATDHSSIQNRVNYSKEFVITKQDVDQFKKYASKYTKPKAPIWYIHDACLDIFKQNSKLELGKLVIDGVNCTTDTKNAVVFEVYDNDKLVFVSPKSTFKLPEADKEYSVFAVLPSGGKTLLPTN